MSKDVMLAINAKYIEMKLKNILEKRGVRIIEYSKNQSILSNVNYKLAERIELIIVDAALDLKIEELINEILRFRKDIPVVLLSNPLNKEGVVKYLKSGISDFIILPLDHKKINSTLDKFLHTSKKLAKINNVNNRIKSDLSLELKKARKGKYPIVFSLMVFKKNNKGYGHAEKFLKAIINDLWDTDQIMFFKKNVLLGIHPFSCTDSKSIIEDKFKEKYKVFKSEEHDITQVIEIKTVVKPAICKKDYSYYKNIFEKEIE